jgi:threonyl-tRNA synthetase
MLKQWKNVQEEAARRDHRKIGQDQDLFFFDPVSAGSCFFLPNGEKVYERLIGFMKRLIFLDGYEMVISPNIFNAKLWMTSGHWQNYRENMFSFSIKEVCHPMPSSYMFHFSEREILTQQSCHALPV